MALVRALLKLLMGLVATSRPLGTLLCTLLLLLVGIHAAGEPVAVVARVLLDLVDSGVDWVASVLVDVWAEVWSWGPRRRDDAVEAFATLVDVPEKLAMVHAVGLLLEGMLFFAWWRLAWNADPFDIPRVPPAVMVTRLRVWWLGLPRFVRVERGVLLALGTAGVLTMARVARTQAVAVAASGQWVGLEWLSELGIAAAVLAAWLGVSAALLPLLASSPQRAARSGKTRRILVLATAPLLFAAFVGAAAW